MPTYEYVCDACKHAFDEFQSFSDKPLKKCPKCKKSKLRRLFGTGAAVIFKGSGFYQTDYRSEGYKAGAKADAPWTMTTMGASVDGKPLMGKEVTMTGEIIDFSCYLQIGKHGEKHRACGQKCFNNGQPIGLLTEDGSVYMLMDEEHDQRRDGQTDFRKSATEHAAHIMEVTGTMTQHAGVKAIFVQGFLKK